MSLCGKEACDGNCKECQAICEAAQKNAENFGAPEQAWCGCCGEYFDLRNPTRLVAFKDHMERNKGYKYCR